MLDHFHECGRAMDLLHKAEDILKINIKQLCSIDTDPNLIQKTELAQPIVAVADLMAAELMREKYTLDFSKVIACSGFSLGELSALCFAGAISFEDTLHLVKLRAEAMADCGGAMCNVKGLSYKETQRLCKRFSCSIANVICDHASAGDQNDVSKSNVYVCSGLTTSINKLVEHLNKHTDEELEQVRSKKLRVSGAFHSHHMKTAARKFEDALKSINIKLPGNCLVYSNVTGRPYSSVDEIRRLLPYQITQPV
jgi:(acyl-carrier-protein) S-malonyltransferase